MLDGWQPYLRALWIVDCCAVRSGSHGHCFTSKHTHTPWRAQGAGFAVGAVYSRATSPPSTIPRVSSRSSSSDSALGAGSLQRTGRVAPRAHSGNNAS